MDPADELVDVVDEDEVAAVDVERKLGVRGTSREPAL